MRFATVPLLPLHVHLLHVLVQEQSTSGSTRGPAQRPGHGCGRTRARPDTLTFEGSNATGCWGRLDRSVRPRHGSRDRAATPYVATHAKSNVAACWSKTFARLQFQEPQFSFRKPRRVSQAAKMLSHFHGSWRSTSSPFENRALLPQIRKHRRPRITGLLFSKTHRISHTTLPRISGPAKLARLSLGVRSVRDSTFARCACQDVLCRLRKKIRVVDRSRGSDPLKLSR